MSSGEQRPGRRRVTVAVVAVAVLMLAGEGPVTAAAAQPALAAQPARTVAASTPAPVGTCGWSNTLARQNPAAEVMAGRISLVGKTHRIGTGAINWSANPQRSLTWRLWFGSLKWSEDLLYTYESTGQRAYLDRATAIARDFLAHNRDPGVNTDLWVDHATSMRTSFLLCLERHVGKQAWLTSAITVHGNALANPKRYSGAFNHGIMQNIALLAAACATGRTDWRTTSVSRQTAVAKSSVDAQGVLDEQAVGYAEFVWNLWQAVLAQHAECGAPTLPGVAARLAQVHRFVAHGTTPDGHMVTIGDTPLKAVNSRTGPWAAYAASAGASGTRPGSTVAVYGRGYVFGRSGWGETRPYAQEQQYSIRFGPARMIHGHHDHLGVTFYSGGRKVLVDSGFGSYDNKPFRAWTMSPEAHSVPVLPGVPFNKTASTTLVGTSAARGMRTFTLSDRAYPGTTRRRTVAVAENPNLMMVRDDVTTDRARQVRMLWHLDPSWRAERRVNAPSHSVATFLSPDRRSRAWVVQLAAPGERLPRTASVVLRGRSGPYQGWVTGENGVPAAAPVVETQRYGKKVTTMTAIVVLPVGQTLTTSRRRAGNTDTITVVAGGVKRIFRTGPGGGIWAG